MAKFWRNIRNILHNVPIPGVGVTINQAKEIATVVKGSPGGTVTYQPPATGTPPTGDLISAFRTQPASNKLMLYGLIGTGIYLFTR